MISKGKLSILLIIFFIFLYNAYSDETSDKRGGLSFSFYFKQSQSYDFDALQTQNLFLKNEFSANFSFPYKFWSISLLLNDIFITDFYPAIYYSLPKATDMLQNIFSLNLENKLHFKNAVKIFFNLGLDLNTPFYDYPSIIFNPGIKFEGNYYYGFFWSLAEIIPVDYKPDNNNLNISSLNMIKIGYEFFRNWGPHKFKFSLLTENYTDVNIYNNFNPKIINNEIKNGFGINLYGLSIYNYFINILYYGYEDKTLFNNYVGINLKIDYSIKNITFSIDYTGLYDLKNPDNKFFNQFEFYIKIAYYRLKKW